MAENPIIERKLNTPGPKELLYRYIPYLPLIILCVSIAWGLAWLKLRYATPIYNVAGKLLVKDQNSYGNTGEKFSSIFAMPQDNTNLNNEIEVIKSRSMAARVIKNAKLQKQFYIKGKIRTSEASAGDMPFSWEIESITDSASTIALSIRILNNEQFKINDESSLYNFGQLITIDKIKFRLIPKHTSGLGEVDNEYLISWYPIPDLAARFSNTINIVQLEGASVLNVTYNTPNIKNGLVVVNAYMNEYQAASLEDKRSIARYTLEFIDDQLDTLKRELGGVEQNLQRFRESNKIFNTEVQAAQNYSRYTETEQRLAEQGVKIKVVDYLSQYISDPKNSYKLVPSNLGIDEQTLTPQINGFNELQLRRETALRTTTPDNPIIKNYEAAIERLRNDLVQNLQNVKNSYVLSRNEMANLNAGAVESLRAIPGKEKTVVRSNAETGNFTGIIFLSTAKKLETAISSASTVSDIKILEPAIAGGYPIQPNRKGLFTIAIFFGLVIPGAFIFLREFLNDKVNSRLDIEEITEAPILGEVGHAEDSNTLVVKENNRSYVAEQFRIIRSNLQYLLPKNEIPVILVTSTFSGEGKSFVSTNLGSVLALSGKKTVVLEMDIRKPKILRGLGMNERKGITNYVVSDIRVEEIIYKVPECNNLYVIPCGPVPPNPGEILLDERIGELFAELKKKFDTIIIDSAPVGLVSDGIALSNFANATVYIVRHNYTLKKQIQLVDEIFENKKLSHLSIVINDIQISGGYGGYYGYGYGYGFGKQTGANEYFRVNKSKPQKWSSKILNFLR